jgi:hypothetical protein
VNDQHFGYITKSLKGNLAPTDKAQWWKSGGQKGDMRALKILSSIRICWRIWSKAWKIFHNKDHSCVLNIILMDSYIPGFMGYGMYYRAREFTHLPPFTPYLIDEQLLFWPGVRELH